MKLKKSSRHAKIAGDFGERLVLYWLSKYGFESAYIDHVGIDIIARNPHTSEVMGISVKSRTRNHGTEGTALNIPNENIEKCQKACEAFGCIPYFAIVVDEGNSISVFLLKMDYLLTLFPCGEKVISWKMNRGWVNKYKSDKNIMSFSFETKTGNWWHESEEVTITSTSSTPPP